MGIKVTAEGGQKWRHITIPCPNCGFNNTQRVDAVQGKGDAQCVGCGIKLHWEETEDDQDNR